MSLNHLKKRAERACKENKHTLGDWRDESNDAYAVCSQCGLGVRVTSQPEFPFNPEVSGYALGRKCKILQDTSRPSGLYKVKWQGKWQVMTWNNELLDWTPFNQFMPLSDDQLDVIGEQIVFEE